MRKIPEEWHQGIAARYTHWLWPMSEIAKDFGVSRQAIWKVLKGADVDTSKGQRIKLECSWCGKPVLRVKSRVRGRKRVFCQDSDCYFDWMRAGGNLSSLEITRAIVGRYFELGPDMVVHNEDGVRLNNMPCNLKVFADHVDHMKYHYEKHSGKRVTVPVLWDGRV